MKLDGMVILTKIPRKKKCLVWVGARHMMIPEFSEKVTPQGIIKIHKIVSSIFF